MSTFSLVVCMYIYIYMYLHGQRLWALACTLDPKPPDLKPQTLNPKSNEPQARNLNPDKPPKPQALHPKLLN